MKFINHSTMSPPAMTAAPTVRTTHTEAEDLEILLIKVGGRSFGIPLSQVAYVAAMPTDFAAQGAACADYFVHEGRALPYVSLWDALMLPSEYAEYVTLQGMLPERRQDHLDWIGALEHALHSGTPFSKARSARDCAFGKWYYAYHARDRRLALLLNQFDQPHVAIHALADRLLGLSEGGRKEDALQILEDTRRTTLATLLRLFDSAQSLLQELQRRIAIIAENGDEVCALGADGVHDIIKVPAQRLQPDRMPDSRQKSHAIRAMIVLDDKSIVPLLDWQALNAGIVPAALPPPASAAAPALLP